MHDHTAINLSVQTLLNERHSVKKHGQSPIGKGQWIGPFQSKRRGHGTEFDDLRHYYPGDDPRHIDWKASARTDVLHTRLYREEREFRTTIIADLRNCMFTGSTQLQAIRICRIAARLIWQATDGGSRTHVIIITDTGLILGEPGITHHGAINACGLLARQFTYLQCRLASKHASRRAAVYPQADRPSDPTIELASHNRPQNDTTIHLDQVCQWLTQQPTPASTVLWISAFDFCGNTFNDNLELLSTVSENAAIVVEDTMLSTGLPNGRYGFSPGQSATTSTVDKRLFNQDFAVLDHRSRKQLLSALIASAKQREQRFSKLGIPLLHIEKGLDEIVSMLRHERYLP